MCRWTSVIYCSLSDGPRPGVPSQGREQTKGQLCRCRCENVAGAKSTIWWRKRQAPPSSFILHGHLALLTPLLSGSPIRFPPTLPRGLQKKTRLFPAPAGEKGLGFFFFFFLQPACLLCSTLRFPKIAGCLERTHFRFRKCIRCWELQCHRRTLALGLTERVTFWSQMRYLRQYFIKSKRLLYQFLNTCN